MAFDENFIEKVRAVSDIISVAEGYFPLKKAGANFTALCPFHSEKTPSFIISRQKQIFKCFGCGEGGNVFSFLMKMEKVSFPEAVRMLAVKAGIPVPDKKYSPADKRKEYLYSVMAEVAGFYAENFKKSSNAKKYAASRGLTEDVSEKFNIGFSPDETSLISFADRRDIKFTDLEMLGLVVKKDRPARQPSSALYADKFRYRLIFPICDIKGRVIAFGGRTLVDSKVKYLNSPETPLFHKSDVLYAIKEAKRAIIDEDGIIITEGYMDVLTMHQFGFRNTVGVLGTAMTERHVYNIKRFTDNVYLLFDSDAAGINAVFRAADKIISLGLQGFVVRLNKAKDADEFLHRYGSGDLKKQIVEALPVFDFLRDLFKRRFEGKSPSWKAKAVDGLIPYIQAIPNAVTKDEEIKKTAEFLGVGVSAIVSVIENAKMRAFTDESAPDAHADTEEKIPKKRKLEEDIVSFLVNYPEYVDLFKKNITREDFSYIGAFLEKIYDYYGATGGSVSGFISLFPDEKDAEFINSIAASCVRLPAAEKGVVDKKKILERRKLAQDLINSFRKIMDNEKFAQLRKRIIEHPTKEALESYTRLAARIKK
ncbi:MAG: DNA primase [Elusimicrobia bacterium CG08_land_8_20_14_0_20_44_26]|nr:MAG: DNA primase [Elusimicrobia bacterium CG08_land_8_20_14_0_20_44_26]